MLFHFFITFSLIRRREYVEPDVEKSDVTKQQPPQSTAVNVSKSSA